LSDRRERTRRLVHFAFGFCALLVPTLGRWGSAAVAGAACAYNLGIAPVLRLDRGYRRPGESRFAGLATYPLAVLALVLLAPERVAMAAWGVLAAADPVAAAVGSRWPRPAAPWNSGKSLVGAAAGALVGGIAAAALLRFAGAHEVVLPALAGATAGAVVETIRWPIDDNLPVAAAAAAALAAAGA